MGKTFLVHRGFMGDKNTGLVTPVNPVTTRRSRADAESIAQLLNDVRDRLQCYEYAATYLNRFDNATGADDVRRMGDGAELLAKLRAAQQEENVLTYTVTEHTLSADDELKLLQTIALRREDEKSTE